MLYNKLMEVKIIIDCPDKLTGVSASLFVHFNYSATIVNIMRSFEKRFYHHDAKKWELAFGHLDKLKELLDDLDNVNYQVIDERVSLIDKSDNAHVFCKSHPFTDYVHEFKTEPKYYQLEGFNYGLNSHKWLLGDDPGLGKTHQALNIALAKRVLYGFKHCLVIVGVNNLRLNWCHEIRKHTYEEPYVLGQRVAKSGPRKGKLILKENKERLEDLENGIDNYFIIINVQSLRCEDIWHKLSQMCRRGDIGMVIADEIHKCLEGTSLIHTDKGYLPIQEIVNNKINCNIYSYNISTGVIELKPIEHYHKYSNNDYLLEIETQDGKILKLTPDHKVFTKNRGFVQAQYLTGDDELMEGLQNSCSYVNIEQGGQ